MELSSSSLFQQHLSSSEVCLPLVFLLLAGYWWWWGRDPNRHRYPPGPGWALPLIGNLYQMGSSPHLTFLKWRKQYGPLVFIKMASQNTVIVSESKAMRELLSTVASSGKPVDPFWNMFSYSGHGIVASSGDNATAQRAFTIKTLAELGLSKSGRLEGIIQEEAEQLVKYFEQRVTDTGGGGGGAGAPIRATRLFNGSVTSTLWSTLTGEKVEWIQQGDGGGLAVEADICKYAGGVMEGVNKAVKFGLTAIPGLRFLPVFRTVWNEFKEALDNFHGMVEAQLVAHARVLDTLSPRDYMDHGLIKVGSTREPSSSFFQERGRLNLKTTIKDLYFAGGETMSSALEYLVMYLGARTQIQEKLHKELDAVVGGRRAPTLSDRKMLPYAQAVIMETLRRSAVGAVSPHRILHDIEFRGYLLPKDTLILANWHGASRDPAKWEDTDAFRPERFLNEDESEVVTPEAYMTFGTGRRACIGEYLALDTLFLFMASIFLKFRVEVVTDEDGGFDFDKVKAGLELAHEPFDIRVYRRNSII